MPLYPIKFKPILKEKVWGGTKLKTLLNKDTVSKTVGESWEISGVENTISEVANGSLKGKSLNDLMLTYKGDLMGKAIYAAYGNQFPLLFKFIDAREDLSVQVHPDDELAAKRHNSLGKAEMWYIVQADPEAGLILGFNREMDRPAYQKNVIEGTVKDILHFQEVKKGEVFYIKPGKVHAIGSGVVLAEIQQTSDITYRIYDYDRPDINGKPRDLHTELALDAIDFKEYSSKISYEAPVNSSQKLVASPYFFSSLLNVSVSMDRDLGLIDSFVVYMCVEGEAEIAIGPASEKVKMGETVLIPAECTELRITADSAKLLEVFAV